MRAKIILLVAILLGLVTTFLFFNYMKKYDVVTTANESLIEVVAAKAEIKKNQKIVAGMLQLVQVPKMGVHPQAIKTLAEAEGKIAESNIGAGEVILSYRMINEKDESQFVSRKVKEGNRAVSVAVNFVQSVSNLIEPEDLVDVVYTPPIKTGSNDLAPPSILILEKVRVLAVGRRMVETDKENPYAEYSSVSLEVKPQDEVRLVNADETGKISLILLTRPASGK
jgi:pilus assembly protein CpaB